MLIDGRYEKNSPSQICVDLPVTFASDEFAVYSAASFGGVAPVSEFCALLLLSLLLVWLPAFSFSVMWYRRWVGVCLVTIWAGVAMGLTLGSPVGQSLNGINKTVIIVAGFSMIYLFVFLRSIDIYILTPTLSAKLLLYSIPLVLVALAAGDETYRASQTPPSDPNHQSLWTSAFSGWMVSLLAIPLGVRRIFVNQISKFVYIKRLSPHILHLDSGIKLPFVTATIFWTLSYQAHRAPDQAAFFSVYTNLTPTLLYLFLDYDWLILRTISLIAVWLSRSIIPLAATGLFQGEDQFWSVPKWRKMLASFAIIAAFLAWVNELAWLCCNKNGRREPENYNTIVAFIIGVDRSQYTMTKT